LCHAIVKCNKCLAATRPYANLAHALQSMTNYALQASSAHIAVWCRFVFVVGCSDSQVACLNVVSSSGRVQCLSLIVAVARARLVAKPGSRRARMWHGRLASMIACRIRFAPPSRSHQLH
jgi:hypothetical protein